jgi:phage shock protein C
MSEVKKKLYRSRSDRWLAGVCGGIGDYFNTDPTVIRVIFVLAGLIMGGGLFIYLILWLIIPLEPDSGEALEEVPTDEGE